MGHGTQTGPRWADRLAQPSKSIDSHAGTIADLALLCRNWPQRSLSHQWVPTSLGEAKPTVWQVPE